MPIAVAAALYVAAALSARWLTPWLLVSAAGLVFGLLLLGWREPTAALTRDGELSLPTWLLLGVGMPVHLLVIATGSLTSWLLPLVGIWVAGVGLAGVDDAAVAALAALVLVPAVAAWRGALSAGGFVELALLAAGGYAAPAVFRRSKRNAVDPVAPAALRADLPAAWPDPAAAQHRGIDELRALLERCLEATGAARVTLWDVDTNADRARPALAAGGPVPATLVLTGDPLRWSWEESVAMRLEQPPDWALEGHTACVLPAALDSEQAALLTFEFAAGVALPEPTALEPWASLARLSVAALVRERSALDDRERFQRVLDMLRTLPGRLKDHSFGPDLAEAARQLVGGTGALLSSWTDDRGQILAVVGEDGGPQVGATFGAAECELALAARGGTALLREELRPSERVVPVGAPGERWLREPRAVAVLPLADPNEGITGILAVWSCERPRLDATNFEALKSVGPYAAWQLRHALTFDDVSEQATRDPLTGLFNRRAFEERFAYETARFHRYRRPLSLMVVDLDHFKRVNDELGHEAGDVVLREVAERIQHAVREIDHAARYGGEEFVVILPETGLREAVDAGERLRRAIEEQPVAWQGRDIPVTGSVGVSSCDYCVEDPGELLGSADAALYESKAGGRNRVTAAARPERA